MKRLKKLMTCPDCKGLNTVEVVCSKDEAEYHFHYFGWCRDCLDGYHYSLQIDTVWDKEERI